FKKICAEFEQNFHSFFGEFLKNHNYCVIRGIASKNLRTHTDPIKKMYYNDTIKNSTPAENLYAEHQLRLLFLLLVRGVESGNAYYEFSDGKKVAAHSVDAVVRYIREHFTDITMEMLVKKFGYSERQLLRMIKHHTGNNFKTQVMYHRLQRARQLLESTDLSVKEISEIIGYESPEYFCRLFKRETYRTPLEYRAQMQKKI
ncbi:MAG: helix-turn-helix transcriptional regulator, partial [Clostridia bacterium]|nr:helix-turn-helix transcriptional regulator [Clostridia bacterium]